MACAIQNAQKTQADHLRSSGGVGSMLQTVQLGTFWEGRRVLLVVAPLIDARGE